MRLISSLAVACILCFASCSSRYVRSVLDDIESYIMERPDSALVVLESMDLDMLTTERDRAHHALLHAMALDKNYIDVVDDSLAKTALTYFSKKGPEKYKARALYYLGLSYYYAGDYEKAITGFTEAEIVAEKSDSLYWGFVKAMQASAYSKTHNDSEVLECLLKAYDIYNGLSATYYIDVAKLELARAYFNDKNYKKADSLLSLLTTDRYVNTKVLNTALVYKACMSATQPEPDYRQAIELYDKVLKEYDPSYMTYTDYWAYAFSLLKTGCKKDAEGLISQLSQIDTSATSYYWQYLIEKHSGRLPEALMFLEKSVTNNNEEVVDALKQSLALSQKKYYESKFRESALTNRVRNQLYCITLVLIVIVVLSVMYFVQKYISQQRTEKEKLVEYLEEVRRQLSQYENEDYPTLKKKFISVYKSRFETLGILCEQYLQNKNRDDIEGLMYQKAMLLINDIRNDNVRRVRFESVLDMELDGIMTNFRNEMPKCKEQEITMFSYLVAGFDATTISRLLDMSLNNVYAHKRRLRIKIEEKSPEHSKQFLEMIS
ncbi:MAG: tetratricopeptide repeat protein [Bacteroidales bacterium]|nr:tetratricopeptide repeat protein [Bacteroidales bacterium]